MDAAAGTVEVAPRMGEVLGTEEIPVRLRARDDERTGLDAAHEAELDPVCRKLDP